MNYVLNKKQTCLIAVVILLSIMESCWRDPSNDLICTVVYGITSTTAADTCVTEWSRNEEGSIGALLNEEAPFENSWDRMFIVITCHDKVP